MDIRFFAGDWSKMHQLLPYVRDSKGQLNCSNEYESNMTGYDVVLMAETVYSISTLQNLYELVKKVFIYLFIFVHNSLLFDNGDLVYYLLNGFEWTVHGSFSWSCLHGSKETLFWCWRGNTAISISYRERW